MAYNAIATHNNTVRETEVFFLTSGTSFTPRRSGLARVVRVGGGGPGGSFTAQPYLVSCAMAGGSGGGIIETWEYLEGGVAYPYALGSGGVASMSPSNGGATTFNGVSASGGKVGGLFTAPLNEGLVLAVPPQNSPPAGASPGGAGHVYYTHFNVSTAQALGACMISGAGGSSPYGTGGFSVSSPIGTSAAGAVGTGYGTGGSGASLSWMSGSPQRLGGNGTPGCIEITMFYDTGDSVAHGGSRGIRHSTEEYATGNYWIDGRPIYGRYVDIGTLATATKDIPFDMTGIDIVVRSYGQVKEPNGEGFNYRNLPYAWDPVFITIIPSSANVLPNTLRIVVFGYTPPSGTTAFAIVEYVKKIQ